MSEEKNRLQDEVVNNGELTNEQSETVEPADSNDNLSAGQPETEDNWKEKFDELNNS
jgi:polyhydroxyalkanoate synthesis regulator phasin